MSYRIWNNSVWSLQNPIIFPTKLLSLSCCCLLSQNCHHSLSDVAMLGPLVKLLGLAVLRFCMASSVAAMEVTQLFCHNVGATMPFVTNVIKCHLGIWSYSHSVWNISSLFPHCWPFLLPYNSLSYHPFNNLLFYSSFLFASRKCWERIFKCWERVCSTVYQNNGYAFPSELCLGSQCQEISVRI